MRTLHYREAVAGNQLDCYGEKSLHTTQRSPSRYVIPCSRWNSPKSMPVSVPISLGWTFDFDGKARPVAVHAFRPGIHN